MPSEKVLQSKKETVAQLKDKLGGAVAGVLVDYKGINVADDTKLRRELSKAGVEYSVVKNTLLRFALQDGPYADMIPVLENTTALAISGEDPVAAAKILSDYSEKTKGAFAIKSGFVEGKVLDVAGITALAKLPSKEQLLVQLLSVLNGNIRGLAVALNAIAEKGEPEPEIA